MLMHLQNPCDSTQHPAPARMRSLYFACICSLLHAGTLTHLSPHAPCHARRTTRLGLVGLELGRLQGDQANADADPVLPLTHAMYAMYS